MSGFGKRITRRDYRFGREFRINRVRNLAADQNGPRRFPNGLLPPAWRALITVIFRAYHSRRALHSRWGAGVDRIR
jgi:hypothetical protein